MEKGNFCNNQQMQAKDAPILPLQDDQNALPIIEKSLSHNQHGKLLLGVAPPFASLPGSMSPVGDAADGLNGPVNQDPMWSTLEPNPQTKGQTGNHKGPGTSKGTQNPNSKAPIIAPFREHDLYMPIANVVRIMRRGLPQHAKVADEAKEMVQESVSEFISFITSEANEACQLEHRKTITAEDVIGAMSRLGFEHYVEPLSIYLQKYRESDMLPPMPRRGVGQKSNEVTAITSTTNVLPPFAVVHPQFTAMYGNLFENGGTYQGYHDGSGTSSGSMNMGHILDPPNTVSVCNGSDQNIAPGTGDGPPNGSEEASPSGPTEPGLDFYYPYDQYK